MAVVRQVGDRGEGYRTTQQILSELGGLGPPVLAQLHSLHHPGQKPTSLGLAFLTGELERPLIPPR